MIEMQLSVIIPACDEEGNIIAVIDTVLATLRAQSLSFEIIVVNDNSQDDTRRLVEAKQQQAAEVILTNRTPPRGFGRAIRSGLQQAKGEIIVPFMADGSDDAQDIVRYYRKIQEGYDCVFGSRFVKGSRVRNYPKCKLVINRIANRVLQILFVTRHNDLTNSFKAYRSYVIQDITPLKADHFNITIEMSLLAVIRSYKIGIIPIDWNGRTWGSSKLKLKAMGQAYISTMLKIWVKRLLVLRRGQE